MATGTISGQVLDGNPYPVPGATVSVDGLPNLSATADAQGVYTLTNVPAGTFTVRAEKTGWTGAKATLTVTYPNTLMHNFKLASPTGLLSDNFESGNRNNWTVTGGSTSTAIWNNSSVRAGSGTHAARAGIPGQPVRKPEDALLDEVLLREGAVVELDDPVHGRIRLLHQRVDFRSVLGTERDPDAGTGLSLCSFTC